MSQPVTINHGRSDAAALPTRYGRRPRDTGSGFQRRTPKVSGLLLAKVDEITARMGQLIDAVWTVTEQLEPERARSCRNASPCVR
jgi:hypothetical protein